MFLFNLSLSCKQLIIEVSVTLTVLTILNGTSTFKDLGIYKIGHKTHDIDPSDNPRAASGIILRNNFHN